MRLPVAKRGNVRPDFWRSMPVGSKLARPRNSLLSSYFGRTVLDRERWFCSELVVAAATAAGVLDEEHYPANLMYPRDLCYDEHFDLSPHYEPPAMWYPRAQLEHIGAGVRIINPKE